MTEADFQRQISTWVKWQYPNILFNLDLSGIKLTIGQAAKIKKQRSGRGWPDMFIAEPRNGRCGLYLELKKDTPFKKNGELKAGEHLWEQQKMLEKLNGRGYMAVFIWDFEQAKQIINEYLKQ